jgi:hypothetical protein
MTASCRLEQTLPQKLISPRITVMKAKIAGTDAHKLKRRKYESELRKLQIRLCHLQDWVVSRGLRTVIIDPGHRQLPVCKREPIFVPLRQSGSHIGETFVAG